MLAWTQVSALRHFRNKSSLSCLLHQTVLSTSFSSSSLLSSSILIISLVDHPSYALKETHSDKCLVLLEILLRNRCEICLRLKFIVTCSLTNILSNAFPSTILAFHSKFELANVQILKQNIYYCNASVNLGSNVTQFHHYFYFFLFFKKSGKTTVKTHCLPINWLTSWLKAVIL